MYPHRNIPHCILEGVREVRVPEGAKHITTGSVASHGKWSYGSASLIGMIQDYFELQFFSK